MNTDHTCDTEYDEPCISCARERGLKLRQFGYALSMARTSRGTKSARSEDPEDLELDVESEDIAETRAYLEELKREKEQHQKVRAQNKARQAAGTHSMRMTH